MTVTIQSPAELLTGRVVERDLDVAVVDPRTRTFAPRAGTEETAGVVCVAQTTDMLECQQSDTVTGDCAASAGGGMIACFIDTSDATCGGVETLSCGTETVSGCPVETLDCGQDTVSGCEADTFSGCPVE